MTEGIELEEMEQIFDEVLDEVFEERLNQNCQWGEQNNCPDKWLSILLEEVGEVAEANNDEEYKNYREELIQVAAVAIQMVECYDRNSL